MQGITLPKEEDVCVPGAILYKGCRSCRENGGDRERSEYLQEIPSDRKQQCSARESDDDGEEAATLLLFLALSLSKEDPLKERVERREKSAKNGRPFSVTLFL